MKPAIFLFALFLANAVHANAFPVYPVTSGTAACTFNGCVFDFSGAGVSISGDDENAATGAQNDLGHLGTVVSPNGVLGVDPSLSTYAGSPACIMGNLSFSGAPFSIEPGPFSESVSFSGFLFAVANLPIAGCNSPEPVFAEFTFSGVGTLSENFVDTNPFYGPTIYEPNQELALYTLTALTPEPPGLALSTLGMLVLVASAFTRRTSERRLKPGAY
jgi:hypothetical protein